MPAAHPRARARIAIRTPSDTALCHTDFIGSICRKEQNMANDQVKQTGTQPPQTNAPPQDAVATPAPPAQAQAQHGTPQPDDFDGLEGKKPDELTPEELRLMADTMPGEGPGD
jgi:hypothetical protein